MVEEKLREVPDFPAPLRDLLLHMILSHHGEMEFGSPKVPMFAEAMLLHHLDNLDSKMECMRGMVERDRLVEGVWTGYSSALDRSGAQEAQVSGPGNGAGARTPRLSSKRPRRLKTSAPETAKRPPASSPFGDKLLTALQQEK